MKRHFKGSSFKSAEGLQSHRVHIDDRFLIPSNDIIFSTEVGEGSSARVYRGCFKNAPVALKRFKLSKNIPKYQEMLKKEAGSVLKLKHHNVVECLGVCLQEMTIILEYCCKSLEINGENVLCHTVRQMIDAVGTSLPQDLSFEALYQISEGMVYLHEQNMIHCDLKSHNVLVSSSMDDEDEWIFKISDMGEAHVALDTTYRSTTSCTQRGAVGTIPYQAPELLIGKPKYEKPVDVYSYAMIMYELTHADQEYPWQKDCGSSANRIRNLVSNGERPTIHSEIPVWYGDMMAHCWSQDPSERPTFLEIKQILMYVDVGNNSSAFSPKKLSRNQPTEAQLVHSRCLLNDLDVEPRTRNERDEDFDGERIHRREQDGLLTNEHNPKSHTRNEGEEDLTAVKLKRGKESESLSGGKPEFRAGNEVKQVLASNTLHIHEEEGSLDYEHNHISLPRNKGEEELPGYRGDESLCDEHKNNTHTKNEGELLLGPQKLYGIKECESLTCGHNSESRSRTEREEALAADSLFSHAEDDSLTAEHKSEFHYRNQGEDELATRKLHSLEEDGSLSDGQERKPRTGNEELTAKTLVTHEEGEKLTHGSIPKSRIRNEDKEGFASDTLCRQEEVEDLSGGPKAYLFEKITKSVPENCTVHEDREQSKQHGEGKISLGNNRYLTVTGEKACDRGRNLRKQTLEDQHVMEREEELEVVSNQNTVEKLKQVEKSNAVRDSPQKPTGLQLAEPPEEMLMAWTGYAQKYFAICKLRDFQIKAIACWREGVDCLIVQSTSSGKSVCFQLPAAMGKDGDLVVVVVPIIALAKDQVQHVQDRGIKANLLGSAAQKGAFADVFLGKDKPKIIYVTPETLMGGDTYKGIIGRLLEGHGSEFRVTLFAIDEAHLIREWGGNFRASFDRLSELKHLFPDVPMMALTATLQPTDEEMMQTDILRQPVVLRGTIDRANVSLQLYNYKCPKHDGDWTSVAEQVKDVVGDEKAIVYCSFAKTCDNLCSALLHCGVKSAAYTGHNRTAEEKSAIYDNMSAGDIQVLVATQAFGLGVNIKWIRWIIHIGCPQNIPQWVQESGRSGRDGKPASAAIFFSEHADLQRLKFWVKDATDHAEKSSKIEDFKKVWQYIYGAMAGSCLHLQQKMYFGEDKEPVQVPTENTVCCDGCSLNNGEKYDATKDLKAITDALQELHDMGMKCVTETKILEWFEGKEQDWVKKLAKRDTLEKSPTFGSRQKCQSKLKVVLRQGVGLGMVSLVILITKIKGHWDIVTKYFAFSEENKSIYDRSNQALLLPHPENVQKHLAKFTLKDEEGNTSSNVTSKRGTGIKGDRKILQLLEKGDWQPITKKENYINLGFEGGHNALLYAEDYKNVPGCPVALKKEDFIWHDVAMGKGSGFPKKTLKVSIGGERTEVIIYKNRCTGVKKCSDDGCSFATSNRHRDNRCLRHPNHPLEQSGKCNGMLVYVRPIDTNDSRRWIGFLTEGDEGHTHPCPISTKPGSQLEEMIADCVKRDPTKTPRDLAKGYGLPCFPGAVSPAGASTSCLSKLRNKYLIDTGSATAINLVRKFDVLIKCQVDASDCLHQADEDKEAIQKLTTPYIRWWNASNDLVLAVFLTPQMSEVLALSTFVEADVTFPGCQVMKYLLNVVTFNELTLKWQVVARVLMSRMTTAAYRMAFNRILDIVTEDHPEFRRGQETSAWVVDFSDAQAAALEDTLGATALKTVRGCKVHYTRLCHKMAEKVCSDEEERRLFLEISAAIPEVKDSENANTLFDALCGKVLPSQLPENLLQLQDSQKQLKCKGWKATTSWVDWWRRPRHARMLCTSFKNMPEMTWQISPASTNAVESQNKESKPSTCSVKATLEHIYRCDRSAAYEVLAAQQGVAIGPSHASRLKRRSLQKRWRGKRAKLIEAKTKDNKGGGEAITNSTQSKAFKRKPEEALPCHTCSTPSEQDTEIVDEVETIDTTSQRSANRAWEMKENGGDTDDFEDEQSIPGPSRKSSRKSRSLKKSTEQLSSLDHSMIGKSILVDTEGPGGKRYGFQEAKIVAIVGQCYKARYKKWPTHFAFVDNITSSDVKILD